MPNRLATALATIIAEKQLGGNLGKAAEQIGVSYPSLRAVLAGKGKPNKATATKYQRFLGLDADDFASLLDDAQRGGKPSKLQRAPKARLTTESAPTEPPELNPTNITTRPHNELDRALAALQTVLADDLALKVHAASPGMRALIARMLG